MIGCSSADAAGFMRTAGRMRDEDRVENVLLRVSVERQGPRRHLSTRTTPNENRSVRESRRSPRICSGDMWDAVPKTFAVIVNGSTGEARIPAQRLGQVGRFEFRQPEIENLGVPAPGDEQVRRLDVAMDDAALNAPRPGRRRSRWPAPAACRRHRSAVDAMLERRAFQQLHHDERPFVVPLDFVDRADIRMVQR